MKQEFVIQNQLGLHLRAAAQFVRLANSFKCGVWVERDGTAVNGKSIMGLTTLAAGPGTPINILTDGIDEERALSALGDLINNRFGEE